MLVLSEKMGRLIIRVASTRDICHAVYTLTQLIPQGKVASYGEISKALGVHPRLVAICLSRNKNLVVIPCHRVVYSNGRLGGYSGPGVEFKKRLLALEGVEFTEKEFVARKCFANLKHVFE